MKSYRKGYENKTRTYKPNHDNYSRKCRDKRMLLKERDGEKILRLERRILIENKIES